MTIAGLGNASVPLLPAVSADAGNRTSAYGANESQPISDLGGGATLLDPNFVNFSEAARQLQTPPPGTVMENESVSSTVQTANFISGTDASSVNGYSSQGSSVVESEDLSYSTSLQTLQSLGFIQQGDTLRNSTVSIFAQQSQESVAQGTSVSQQASTPDGETQSSSASQSTQQTASEQNVAVIYTQNWMTPSGGDFVFQEMFRVDQNAITSQGGTSFSLASMSSTDPVSSAIANTAPAMPDVAPAANGENDQDNHAAAKSAAAAQLATLSVQVMNRVLGSWLQVSNTANPGESTGLSGSGNSSAAASVNPADQDAITKQTNSLLALFESLGSTVQSSGTNASVTENTATTAAT